MDSTVTSSTLPTKLSPEQEAKLEQLNFKQVTQAEITNILIDDEVPINVIQSFLQKKPWTWVRYKDSDPGHYCPHFYDDEYLIENFAQLLELIEP